MTDDRMLESVRAKLDEHKGSWPAIAAATKVGYFTISKIATGTTTKPHERTVIALDDYFRKLEAKAKRQAR